MPLDPQAAALLKATAKAKLPPLETLTPEAARKQNAKGIAVVAGHGPDMFSIFETEATGPSGAIPLRVYTPRDARGQTMPLLVFIHGGGHIIGSRDRHDVACRYLAMHGDCIVVSVDYHLAPEHPFPAPLEDCCIATRWIVEHAEALGGRGDWVAIAGDSAGGNLATEVCLAALSISIRYEPMSDDLTGWILATVARNVEDGTFSRLKDCPDCRWIFYDKNRSKTRVWCGMYAGEGGRACGTISKVKHYRQRRKAGE